MSFTASSAEQNGIMALQWDLGLLYGMVAVELAQTLAEPLERFGSVEHRHTDAQPFLTASGRGEGDGRDAVAQQVALEFRSGHAGITYGEEESVGNRFLAVEGIDKMEAVVEEQLFGQSGAAAVYAVPDEAQ